MIGLSDRHYYYLVFNHLAFSNAKQIKILNFYQHIVMHLRRSWDSHFLRRLLNSVGREAKAKEERVYEGLKVVTFCRLITGSNYNADCKVFLGLIHSGL
ncbi:MAG: hypothetical protein AMS27_14300 [Bacteroides sp. SM23_62_1]|nr:MAG: hypothetical protein AMS27_14300 [Bacteroides sp. SM23_62_1]